MFVNTAIVASGQVKFDLLANAPTVDTLTVVRIIGYLDCGRVSTNEVESIQAIDVGIGVASSEAFTIGVTALPSPAVATEYPSRGWLYRSRRVEGQALPTGGSPTAMWRQRALFQFDARAMRKIDKGILYLMATNSTIEGGATSVQVIGTLRALCLT